MSNYNSQLQSNNTDLQTVLQTLQNKAAGSGGEQAIPEISVNTSGLITAIAGTKSSTHQLAFQSAKTITPSTTSQVAVSSGYYTGGNITVLGDSNLVASNIKSGVSIFGVSGTATVGDDPFASVSPFTYAVNAISEASYGFIKNSNGYYESQNKEQNNSYAICRVNLIVNEVCDITFDVINYAESNYDYAIFGNLDEALALTNTADSSAKENFKGKQSASVVNVIYNGVTVGNHYIDIKFIKDSSQHKNNDSVQFKIQEQDGSLSQETINKILAADTDLIPENIRSGINIFGVNGTLVEGSSGELMEYSENEDAMVTSTISNYTNNRVASIGAYAFYDQASLKTVNFPNVTTIGYAAFCYCRNLEVVKFPIALDIYNAAFSYCISLETVNIPLARGIHQSAFEHCENLSTVSFPNVTYIGNIAFSGCKKLSSIYFPACREIESAAFVGCSGLKTTSFPACIEIGSYAFSRCYTIKSLYLTGSSLCTLLNSNAFLSTPFAGYSSYFSGIPYIYVPSSLVNRYKSATNWTYFSSYIVEVGYIGEDTDTNANIIIFSIAGVVYQAEYGMTWGEWVATDYNTGGFVVKYNKIFLGNDPVDVDSVNDIIVEGEAYILSD